MEFKEGPMPRKRTFVGPTSNNEAADRNLVAGANGGPGRDVRRRWVVGAGLPARLRNMCKGKRGKEEKREDKSYKELRDGKGRKNKIKL